MRILRIRSSHATWLVAAALVGLVASACGGSSSSPSATRAATSSAAVASAPTSTSTAAPKPKPTLHILAPKAGAHTGSELTVRVALRGGKADGHDPFRYVLDHRTVRGAAHFAFHNLKPGRHHLTVALVGTAGVSASRSFVVRTPPPAPTITAEPATSTGSGTTVVPGTTSAPTTTAATTTSAPPPTTSAPPPTSSAPPPTTSTPPPSTSTSAPSGGIPQGGGGDGDADNSGGPSDGDGNI